MVLADATVLHGAVPEVQRQLVADAPLLLRLAFAWRGALFDEVVLRLGVVTALVWLGQAGVGLAGWRARWPAILAAAFLAWPLTVLPYLSHLHWDVVTGLREVCCMGRPERSGAGSIAGTGGWRGCPATGRRTSCCSHFWA